MGVGEDDRRWTIKVCPACGVDDRYRTLRGKHHWTFGVRCSGVPVAVEVVPVSVVDGLRGEVERLRDENRRFRTALGIPTLPPCSPDCEACEAESPVDALARVGQDVQPDGYATHTTCPRCEGRRYVSGLAYPCDRCSGSGRVPTKEEN